MELLQICRSHDWIFQHELVQVGTDCYLVNYHPAAAGVAVYLTSLHHFQALPQLPIGQIQDSGLPLADAISQCCQAAPPIGSEAVQVLIYVPTNFHWHKKADSDKIKTPNTGLGSYSKQKQAVPSIRPEAVEVLIYVIAVHILTVCEISLTASDTALAADWPNPEIRTAIGHSVSQGLPGSAANRIRGLRQHLKCANCLPLALWSITYGYQVSANLISLRS